jgi:hypothetical protein
VLVNSFGSVRSSTVSCSPWQQPVELILPGGRLSGQRDAAYKLLSAIPGVNCVKPRGAFYCLPRLNPEVYPIKDDEQFVIDLLRAKKILVTHGTGFTGLVTQPRDHPPGPALRGADLGRPLTLEYSVPA